MRAGLIRFCSPTNSSLRKFIAAVLMSLFFSLAMSLSSSLVWKCWQRSTRSMGRRANSVFKQISQRDTQNCGSSLQVSGAGVQQTWSRSEVFCKFWCCCCGWIETGCQSSWAHWVAKPRRSCVGSGPHLYTCWLTPWLHSIAHSDLPPGSEQRGHHTVAGAIDAVCKDQPACHTWRYQFEDSIPISIQWSFIVVTILRWAFISHAWDQLFSCIQQSCQLSGKTI